MRADGAIAFLNKFMRPSAVLTGRQDTAQMSDNETTRQERKRWTIVTAIRKRRWEREKSLANTFLLVKKREMFTDVFLKFKNSKCN